MKTNIFHIGSSKFELKGDYLKASLEQYKTYMQL